MHIKTCGSARRILEYGLKVVAATLNKNPRETSSIHKASMLKPQKKLWFLNCFYSCSMKPSLCMSSHNVCRAGYKIHQNIPKSCAITSIFKFEFLPIGMNRKGFNDRSNKSTIFSPKNNIQTVAKMV